MSGETRWGAALSVVLFVGSAVRAATPAQRELLRAVQAPLSDKALTASQAYAKTLRMTIEIMGPGWRLDDETQRRIDAMLDLS